MKTVLETIPVEDAFRENTECPVCSLMKKAEKDAVRYYLSSAIMTPEVRVETNRHGFCPHHLDLLSTSGNPQSLALTLDTYYGENEECFAPWFKKIASAPSFAVMKAVEGFRKAAEEREKGCLVCYRMDERLQRYYFTISSLYATDSDFRALFDSSKGLCLHHTLGCAAVAKDALKGNALATFEKALFASLERNLARVRKDDWWMTQMYKSENQGKDWNGAEDAQRRAALKLIGEGRVLDPAKKDSRI